MMHGKLQLVICQWQICQCFAKMFAKIYIQNRRIPWDKRETRDAELHICMHVLTQACMHGAGANRVLGEGAGEDGHHAGTGRRRAQGAGGCLQRALAPSFAGLYKPPLGLHLQ